MLFPGGKFSLKIFFKYGTIVMENDTSVLSIKINRRETCLRMHNLLDTDI